MQQGTLTQEQASYHRFACRRLDFERLAQRRNQRRRIEHHPRRPYLWRAGIALTTRCALPYPIFSRRAISAIDTPAFVRARISISRLATVAGLPIGLPDRVPWRCA